jgi:hypothetical protein
MHIATYLRLLCSTKGNDLEPCEVSVLSRRWDMRSSLC